MKNLSYLFSLLATLSLLSLGSCKKYGFDVADGYGVDSLQENITVDTSDSRPDFSMLAKARIFPGLVDASEPRVENYSVTLDLNYLNEAYNRLRISVIPSPVFGTGMYAAPGEPVTIVVPQGVKGLVCQIGMWTDDLSATTPRRREPIIFDRKILFPGVNHVRNLFGGNIYISTSFPIKAPVQLTFTGACKSPDFVLGKTDPANWKKEIMESKVPWFEFASSHIAFTLPREKMVNYINQHPAADPIRELEAWDQIIKHDYNEWEGLSDTASDDIDKPINLPWRIVLDIQPVVGYGHNGYPVVAQDDGEWFSASMIASDTVSIWGTLHEIGHNNQQGSYWSWSTLGETTNNLFSIKRAHRIGIKNIAALHPNMSTAVHDGLAYTAQANEGKKFDTDPLVNDPFTRMVPFMQLFDKIKRRDGKEDGFGLMPYLYRRARHAQRYSLNDLAKHDFLYEAVCEYTGLDVYKFFQAWGIALSSQAVEAMGKQYPDKLATDIWNYNPITRTGGDNVVDYTIPRAEWQVDFDSEEASGEGADNGTADKVLDGDINTFWHSQWQGATPPYPHYLIIDMMEPQKDLHGIYFTMRQTNESVRPKHVEIWLGPDKEHLVKYMETDLKNQAAQQAVAFATAQTFQVFKLVFTNGQVENANFASMAEINVY